MTNKLTTEFRSHCNEYARQVADLLGYSEWRWVGVGDQGDGTYETLELGDWLYLSLSDCQTSIDRLPQWLSRYGTREAVASEIEAWQEWWLGDDDDPDNTAAVITLWESRRERYLRTYPRLNLEHWLLGCPPRPTTRVAPRPPAPPEGDARTHHGVMSAVPPAAVTLEYHRQPDRRHQDRPGRLRPARRRTARADEALASLQGLPAGSQRNHGFHGFLT